MNENETMATIAANNAILEVFINRSVLLISTQKSFHNENEGKIK